MVSLEELIPMIQAQERSLDQQIEAEHVKQRTAFLRARNRRQQALASLVTTRNEIAEKTRQWLVQTSIDSPNVPKNPVIPYLELQRLEKQYARSLTEAWAAGQMIQLYTVEGQQRVQDETLAHYLAVMQTVDPDFITPRPIN